MQLRPFDLVIRSYWMGYKTLTTSCRYSIRPYGMSRRSDGRLNSSVRWRRHGDAHLTGTRFLLRTISIRCTCQESWEHSLYTPAVSPIGTDAAARLPTRAQLLLPWQCLCRPAMFAPLHAKKDIELSTRQSSPELPVIKIACIVASH